MRAVQKTPKELGFSPPLEKHNAIRVPMNWPLRVRAFSPLPVHLFDAASENGLQRAALPDSLKSNKAEDSSIHCFQFVDYLTNRVRQHVPVENPI
jgi:hypothetical protein